MNPEKKRKIRKIILLSILGLWIIGFIAKFTIEPADYYKSLNSKIEAAEKAAVVEIGNDNGQYSQYTVDAFLEKIREAKAVVRDKNLKHSKIKEYYNDFCDSIKEFKKAGNKDCLSESDVQKLISEGKDFQKSTRLSDAQSVHWQFSAADIQQGTAINLGVKQELNYADVLKKYEEQLNLSGFAVAFLHNGSFPCALTVTVSVENVSASDNVQVYRFNPAAQEIGEPIPSRISDGQVSFAIAEGGVYFIFCGTPETGENETTQPTQDTPATGGETSPNATQTVPTEAPVPTEQGHVNPHESTSAPTQAPALKPTQPPETEPPKNYCTIEIRCDTVVDTSKLTRPEVAPYIPKDGTILATTKVEFIEGETVFELLKRITREEGIQMEFRHELAYSGGAYIEGINHLYEFDAGSGSGWMYKVNGWFPNYGCHSYKIKPGDAIVWCYTCNIGKDVGDQYYD